jgi:putative transposase
MDQTDSDLERMQWVHAAYLASHRRYGYRRIKLWLVQKRGVTLNHKTVLRLMHKLGVRSIARQPKPYRRMTDGENDQRDPNLLDRDFSATRPNPKWVTDVTQLHTQHGWAYLSVIQDLYDGFIVAYQFGPHNSLDLVDRTLRQAQRSETPSPGLLLHSDQGYQYRSRAYRILTQTFNVVPSMSRRGNCWDNAPIESFFGHLKEEALRHVPNPTFEVAAQVIDEYMTFYNYERIQLKTKLTPYERRCQFG